MTTVRYSRYVVVNVESGEVVWSDSEKGAQRALKSNGGTMYDYDNDDTEKIEKALHAARMQMGVE